MANKCYFHVKAQVVCIITCVISMACVLLCDSPRSVQHGGHQVSREIGILLFMGLEKEFVARANFRMTHCSEPNRFRFPQVESSHHQSCMGHWP